MPLHVSGALPERFTKGAIGQYLADLNAFSTQVVWEDAVARINGTLPEEHVVCFELPSFQQLVCLEAVGVASYFSNLHLYPLQYRQAICETEGAEMFQDADLCRLASLASSFFGPKRFG